MTEYPVPGKELLVSPPRRETGCADSNRLQDTTGSQLSDRKQQNKNVILHRERTREHSSKKTEKAARLSKTDRAEG